MGKTTPISAKGFSCWFFGEGDVRGLVIDIPCLSLKKAAIFMDDFFGMAFGSQSSFHDSIMRAASRGLALKCSVDGPKSLLANQLI